MIESVGIVNECHKIGDRIECDNYRGIICYIGTVAGTSGPWLGIDWDDPARGKHNGTYNGIEYFKTRHPTSGSFVRPGKVKTGISCPQAIRNRYGLVSGELAGVDRDDIASLKAKINAPFLEMVGFEKVNKKQSTFDQLKVVALREQSISNAGAPGELGELCPNIIELDLSKNLINSWRIIAEICSQLKSLQCLNVSDNYLPTKEDDTIFTDAFPNVHQLTMSRMNYDWSDITWCTTIFPSLKTLHVLLNNASILEKPLHNSNLSRIVDLSLEGNGICSWDEILKLGTMECLENLNLNANSIDKIRLPSDDVTRKTNLFPALRQLHLSSNCITEWRSISELEKLKKLENFKIRDNPVLNNDKSETVRQLIVARISGLKLLNGIEITRGERRGSEYDYLKMFAAEWLELNAADNADKRRKEFLENHPRYLALIEQHGNPEVLNTKTDEMKSDVITVEFVCMNESAQVPSMKRKLLKDMDVQKISGLAQRVFKTGGKIPTLSFVQINGAKEEIPLDKPLQQLRYYSIQNGDRVLVRW